MILLVSLFGLYSCDDDETDHYSILQITKYFIKHPLPTMLFKPVPNYTPPLYFTYSISILILRLQKITKFSSHN